MSRERDRRLRLRLARQRPTPRRVRQLPRDATSLSEPPSEPDPDTGPAVSWWRRVPWVHVGTVVGSVAAIGGLIFTGIATYYSAAVSHSQLEQSREDSQKRSKAQADRVSWWWHAGTDGGRLHLMNRSPDPVLGVTVGMLLLRGKQAIDPQWVQIFIHALPPCSDAALTESRLSKAASRPFPVDPGDQVAAVTMYFTDRSGQTWKRDGSDLEPSEGRPSGTTVLVALPPVKPLEACGDGTS